MQDLLFSGVSPSGMPHLGNYIGALKQWVSLQHEYKCYFCIVDLHAITVPQDPKELRQNSINLAASYLAIGLDPKRCTLFVQSEVPEHLELAWVMSSIAKMGEMERMTQFKDKSQKGGRERSSLGLFTYPALMAADILLYDTTIVPVGDDQTQHVELTRVLARRFNDHFGPTFTEPKVLIQKHGARIMSLAHPEQKMSKSDESKNGVIMLDDDAEAIRHKIMRAVTDSEVGVKYDEEKKPALANLLTIYHHMSGKTMEEIEKMYAGKGYGDFKKGLAEVVIEHLAPISKKLKHYREHPQELIKVLDHGRDEAHHAAREKMSLVRDRIGLGRV